MKVRSPQAIISKNFAGTFKIILWKEKNIYWMLIGTKVVWVLCNKGNQAQSCLVNSLICAYDLAYCIYCCSFSGTWWWHKKLLVYRVYWISSGYSCLCQKRQDDRRRPPLATSHPDLGTKRSSDRSLFINSDQGRKARHSQVSFFCINLLICISFK